MVRKAWTCGDDVPARFIKADGRCDEFAEGGQFLLSAGFDLNDAIFVRRGNVVDQDCDRQPTDIARCADDFAACFGDVVVGQGPVGRFLCGRGVRPARRSPSGRFDATVTAPSPLSFDCAVDSSTSEEMATRPSGSADVPQSTHSRSRYRR